MKAHAVARDIESLRENVLGLTEASAERHFQHKQGVQGFHRNCFWSDDENRGGGCMKWL